MARQPRIKDDFGVFYITQYSRGERDLFECNQDRERFLEILYTVQTKFDFKLYAYCIAAKNEYHLVLDVNGGDLSKIMKSINIRYAMYAKCSGKLFKDRYKSQLLNTEDERQAIINDIHDRLKERSAWNSYCSLNGLITDEQIVLPALSPITNDNQELVPSDECIDCINFYEEAEVHLKEIAQSLNVPVSELIKDKTRRNQLICEFRKQSTLSLKELGQLFGGISESSVCKIINQ
ncbi:transposase [Haloplasma contractile]|uniref:Chromosomal replication initiator protein DnaA n=1 Tax=Haloplasma contractile SSD-17B TaxID=1033810 RepID=F7PTK8_9MOLU|nr:transposase [Haloplasma contractile]ERJ12169.1 Chromosomal replication initiator protein DnaA [Haloplasma contractile SSD-17B]